MCTQTCFTVLYTVQVYTIHKIGTGFTGSKLLYKCTRYKQIMEDKKWKVDIWKMKGQFQLDNTHTHTQGHLHF